MRQPDRKRKSAAAWPVAYRWAAMGTLVIYTAVGTQTVQLASAQDASPAPVSRAADPNLLVVRRFDIPAGMLDDAVAAFQQETGLTVEMSRDGLRSLPSQGIAGLYTTSQALRTMLAGTGVTFRLTSSGNIVLELAATSTAIDVNASAAPIETSLPKYSEPLLDTPQTISTVPQEVMEQQGATTLRDALRNVAGISLAAGEAGAQGDNLTIRGFSARNDLFIDGMRDFGSYYRDPFNTQEVEVLQGPSSVTFGRGSTGGVVNQASKTPGLAGFLSGEADFGTDSTRRAVFDIDTALPRLGSGAAFRMNVMGDEGGVAGRDVAFNRRYGLAPSLALGLGTPTRVTFSYLHQTANDRPDYGIPWLFNGPAPVNRSNYYGFRDGNFLHTNDDIGTAKVEHDFNSHFTLRNQVRYANYVRNVLITEPQVLNASINRPLSALQINRNELAAKSTETNLDEQLDLITHFDTGAIHHSVIAGVEAGRETSDPIRYKYSNVLTTSLLQPNPNDPFTGIPVVNSLVHTKARSVAAYALDTVRFGTKWELSGGIRWDRFEADYTQAVAPVAAFNRVDEMPTWRTALVYKPMPIGSVYFSAGTSFNPSAESLSFSSATANLPPEKNRTFEFGSKWDVSNGKLSMHGALFRTEKTNAREPDPTNPLVNVLAGQQRVDGLEVDVRGRLTSRWDVLSSYAYLDSKVVNSKYYPAAVGAQLANVPRNTFNLWTTYRLPHRTEIGAGGNFVASRTASSTVPLDPTTGLVKQVPGYWVFNAMASHALGEHVSLQANVYNLANRYYYDELHPGHIVLGAGRSALIGLKFKF